MKPAPLQPSSPPNLGFPLSFTAEPELLTLHLQVLLRLEVFDGGMVHDANHGHAVVLPADGERQPAGDRVHLVVGQLHPGLPCGEEERRGDVQRGRLATFVNTMRLQKCNKMPKPGVYSLINIPLSKHLSLPIYTITPPFLLRPSMRIAAAPQLQDTRFSSPPELLINRAGTVFH